MEIKVITEFNADVIIQQVINDTHPTQNIAKDIINLKDQGVIDALIALGWTPPKEDKLNDRGFDPLTDDPRI